MYGNRSGLFSGARGYHGALAGKRRFLGLVFRPSFVNPRTAKASAELSAVFHVVGEFFME